MQDSPGERRHRDQGASFQEQLAHDVASGSANRHAGFEFLQPRGAARKEERGKVKTRDQQHQNSAPNQQLRLTNEGHIGAWVHSCPRHSLQAHQLIRDHRTPLLAYTRQDGLKLQLQPVHAHPRGQSHNHAQRGEGNNQLPPLVGGHPTHARAEHH